MLIGHIDAGDLGLPEIDGLTVLGMWRKEGRKFPVLVLTARDSWHEKVQGIDGGADGSEAGAPASLSSSSATSTTTSSACPGFDDLICATAAASRIAARECSASLSAGRPARRGGRRARAGAGTTEGRGGMAN